MMFSVTASFTSQAISLVSTAKILLKIVVVEPVWGTVGSY